MITKEAQRVKLQVDVLVLTLVKKCGKTNGVKIQVEVDVLPLRKKSGKTKEDTNFV